MRSAFNQSRGQRPVVWWKVPLQSGDGDMTILRQLIDAPSGCRRAFRPVRDSLQCSTHCFTFPFSSSQNAPVPNAARWLLNYPTGAGCFSCAEAKTVSQETNVMSHRLVFMNKSSRPPPGWPCLRKNALLLM